MSLIFLLAFAVLMYAIRSGYDVTLNGNAGFLAFSFEAKNRDPRGRRQNPMSLKQQTAAPIYKGTNTHL
jgi:hypothetical protein